MGVSAHAAGFVNCVMNSFPSCLKAEVKEKRTQDILRAITRGDRVTSSSTFKSMYVSTWAVSLESKASWRL